MTLLPSTDFYPVTTASGISAAKRLIHERSYDIVFINAPLPDDFGLQFAIDCCNSSNAGVLLLVNSELYNDVYSKALDHGVLMLSKPTSSAVISQTLRILCATRERLRRFEARQTSVEEKMEEIRLVNRAKWVLIETLGMTEADAHRYIEKSAMDRRVTRRAAAEVVIKTYQNH